MRLSFITLVLAAAAKIVAAKEDLVQENTYFNGKKVPPLQELTPDTFAQDAGATKWMLIKHYSPYCPHCIDFAPTFQTLYEYYYTQSPGGTDAEDDFSKTYEFHFATVNCIAYFDLCTTNGVKSYPTTILFKNGEVVDTIRGVKDMATLSSLVEKSLNEEKPGSRPEEGKLSLPSPGARDWPPKEENKEDANTAESKDEFKVEEKPQTPAEKTEEKPAEKEADTELKRDDVTPEEPKIEKKLEEPTEATETEEEKMPAFVMPTYHIPSIVKPASTGTANPNGISVDLNAEAFRDKVTLTEDAWFVKFYAPWCHHCQALAPVWEQVAKSMSGKLNIGEVNCDRESRLCKDVGIHGFPTIYFFQGGERVEYEDLRGLGDFVKFGEKAVDVIQGVQDVTLEEFEALEEKEEVIFVYFYDHASVTEDFMALERLPLPLIGRAKIVRTRDPRMYDRYKITTWPRILVSREGRPTYYQPLTPQRMRDVNSVLDWMKSVWLPIVPELKATNAREIMDGKMVVLGILNRDETDSYQRALKEMKTAATEWMDKQIQQFQLERQELRDAKQLRIEEAEDRGDSRALRQAKHIRINMDMSDRKQVTFAWVDGVFWQRWVRSTYGIDVANGERVIINDEDNKRYWDETITGNPIVPSRTSILETLGKVTATPPKIKPKLTISSIEKVFFDIRMTFVEHPYLCGASITGFFLAALIWYRGRTKRRGGYFRVEDTQGIKDLKGGLLGGVSSNGKAD
ncbi:Thioredoxin domain-containing protein 5 [Zalerion maritima]|uniref:Thioredoxin domain-containing protein 5 n=1 Tax=Zalerion maritima TaxID=339359 RepID=A0AAD5RS28_9PEZI|nr:Thioredoxin domain-containing protein 5 [Zalerion maritima]